MDSIPAPVEIRRGAKRQASPVEDIINNGSLSRKAGKRARRQSRKLQDIFDENQGNGVLMDIDRASIRGKKGTGQTRNQLLVMTTLLMNTIGEAVVRNAHLLAPSTRLLYAESSVAMR